jgi:hypothetical protein
MTERYDLRDQHGRTTGYVLQESPHRATHFRSGSRTPQSESPLAVAVCLTLGVIMLAATLVYLWVAVTAG